MEVNLTEDERRYLIGECRWNIVHTAALVDGAKDTVGVNVGRCNTHLDILESLLGKLLIPSEHKKNMVTRKTWHEVWDKIEKTPRVLPKKRKR